MKARRVDLSEIQPLAREITESVIWCTVTTVSPSGEPRSRLMHPVWFWEDGEPYGLVTGRRTPVKVAHLDHNDAVACFYWSPAHHTAEVDATAGWLDEHQREAAWEAIAAVEPPVGFDPAMIWPDGPHSDDCGFLRFDARRIVATRAAETPLLWTAPPPAESSGERP